MLFYGRLSLLAVLLCSTAVAPRRAAAVATAQGRGGPRERRAGARGGRTEAAQVTPTPQYRPQNSRLLVAPVSAAVAPRHAAAAAIAQGTLAHPGDRHAGAAGGTEAV
jgi:hypothetical protein